METFPLSQCMILQLMLVKWLSKFLSWKFPPRRIARDEPCLLLLKKVRQFTCTGILWYVLSPDSYVSRKNPRDCVMSLTKKQALPLLLPLDSLFLPLLPLLLTLSSLPVVPRCCCCAACRSCHHPRCQPCHCLCWDIQLL